MEEKVDATQPASNNENMLPSWVPVPHIGMRFENLDEAWRFWLHYGVHTGFDVRKRYTNQSRSDSKVVTSCRYVCSKEGHRLPDKRDHLTKRPRPETRTDCQVRMGLTMDRELGKYEVSDLVLEHNHLLLPETLHLRPSQRKISEVDAFEIEIDDDSGGSLNLSFTHSDHKNYLPSKCQREMPYGDAGSMLKYFQDKIVEDPSFQYALQMDCEEKLANIFFADSKMIIDYAHFGDVITFDTTFATSKEYKPLCVFVGFNQFREAIIFGVAFLYDKTFESYRWLLETFLKAHNGNQPRTIFTDQDIAMGQAVATVFSEAWHGLCTFQIMQSANKHLTLQKNEKSNVLSDFSACMYEYKDESKFEEAFCSMRNKVQKQTWFEDIYKLKEKWAECYMRSVLTLGMRSTRLSESLYKDLKKHLKSDDDVIQFLKHFESLMKRKRKEELDMEFDPRKKSPRIKMRTPMLFQASKRYTPIMFEAFQAEYERSMAACVVSDGDNEYRVAVGSLDEDLTFEDEYKVIGNPSKQTALCSCEQFNRTGILCAHALKVLDWMNIKSLPSHYVLKRWTWEAQSGAIHDKQGRNVLENPGLDAMGRYKFLSQKFLNLVYRAANFPECCLLIDSTLGILGKQVEDRINAPYKVQEDDQAPSGLVNATCQHKREVWTRGSK